METKERIHSLVYHHAAIIVLVLLLGAWVIGVTIWQAL